MDQYRRAALKRDVLRYVQFNPNESFRTLGRNFNASHNAIERIFIRNRIIGVPVYYVRATAIGG